MQIERKQISLFTGTFTWVILIGIGNMIRISLNLDSRQGTIYTIVYAAVLVAALVVMYILTKKLTPEGLVPITKKDSIIFKVISYSVVALFVASLILTNGKVIKDSKALLAIGYSINAVNILISIAGIVYTSIILVKTKEPKSPKGGNGQVIDADFEEKEPLN